jgi:hypothetical protein
MDNTFVGSSSLLHHVLMDFLKDFPREPLLQSLDFARACRGRDIRWRGRFLVEQAVYSRDHFTEEVRKRPMGVEETSDVVIV